MYKKIRVLNMKKGKRPKGFFPDLFYGYQESSGEDFKIHFGKAVLFPDDSNTEGGTERIRGR